MLLFFSKKNRKTKQLEGETARLDALTKANTGLESRDNATSLAVAYMQRTGGTLDDPTLS